MPTELLHISELPDDTRDVVCDQIAMFTVGLQRLVGDDGRDDIQLIGTGTLVIVGGRHCILTAEHVLPQLKEDHRLALLSSFSGAARRHTFEYSHLRIHRIAKGENDAAGPDVGLIVLPEANLGTLRAEKTFFNIDKRLERFANTFLEKELGFWFSCGIIGETETQLPLQAGFRQVKGFQALCGAAGRPRERMDENFDYLDVNISYEPQNPELPRSFGGYSGSGLWHVLLRKDVDGTMRPEECVLSGIVFFQTAVENGIRTLRCHGRKTIYSVVPKFVAGLHGV